MAAGDTQIQPNTDNGKTAETPEELKVDRAYWSQYHGIYDTMRAALCARDGKPSSTRLHMFYFGLMGMTLVVLIFLHLFHISHDAMSADAAHQAQDMSILTLWISNLPIMLGMITALIVSAYSVNQGTTLVGKFIEAKKPGPAPGPSS